MSPCYLFDLDGTLVDSMQRAVKIVLDYLTEYGVEYPDGFAAKMTPLGFRGIAEYYSREMGIPRSPEEIYQDFQLRLQLAYAKEMPLKPQVKESLETLKKQGARLNVLTASPHDFCDACLKNHGVFHLFENVWSAEEDFALRKANEEIYLAAANRLGVSIDECIMVDDSAEVIKTAKSAGMKTIGVFDDFWSDKKAELQEASDQFAEKFGDILFLPRLG